MRDRGGFQLAGQRRLDAADRVLEAASRIWRSEGSAENRFIRIRAEAEASGVPEVAELLEEVFQEGRAEGIRQGINAAQQTARADLALRTTGRLPKRDGGGR